MACTDAVQFGPLRETDIAGCMALSAEAGWNQTSEDWALFLRHGTVLGLGGMAGQPVATGAIFPYGKEFAWISMVLVTQSRRRRRIGTAILKTCCAELERRGLVGVLDATPAGEQIYRPLGFEPMFGLARWQGKGGAPAMGATAAPGIRAMNAADIAALAAFDAAIFGAPRTFLLENFLRRAPQLAFIALDASGFVLARPGRIATQIGPLAAAHEDAASALLSAALDAVSGPVFLDLSDRCGKLAGKLQQRGFTVQRPFLRMGLRRHQPFGDADRTFVVAGPEFG